LALPVVREAAGGGVQVGERAAVGVAGGVETVGEPGVGGVPLALGRIASEADDGDCERRGEQQERGDEPGPGGPRVYFPPPWRCGRPGVLPPLPYA
jgi:hypothetical protein